MYVYVTVESFVWHNLMFYLKKHIQIIFQFATLVYLCPLHTGI